jgi:hypothetical protein
MTGVLQQHARKHVQAIDTLSFGFEVRCSRCCSQPWCRVPASPPAARTPACTQRTQACAHAAGRAQSLPCTMAAARPSPAHPAPPAHPIRP